MAEKEPVFDLAERTAKFGEAVIEFVLGGCTEECGDVASDQPVSEVGDEYRTELL
jgi:hypothetical protein